MWRAARLVAARGLLCASAAPLLLRRRARSPGSRGADKSSSSLSPGRDCVARSWTGGRGWEEGTEEEASAPSSSSRLLQVLPLLLLLPAAAVQHFAIHGGACSENFLERLRQRTADVTHQQRRRPAAESPRPKMLRPPVEDGQGGGPVSRRQARAVVEGVRVLADIRQEVVLAEEGAEDRGEARAVHERAAGPAQEAREMRK